MPRRAAPWPMTLLAVAALALAACGGGEAALSGEGAARVVVGNAVIADWVSNVGGDLVSVTTLTPPGADAHTFQLTPGELTAVADAALVVLSGGGLEASFGGAVRDAASGRLITLADSVELQPFPGGLTDAEHEDGEAPTNGLDPHFWLDPQQALHAIVAIRDALTGLLPDEADAIQQRADAYAAQVRAADAEAEQALAALPPAQRVLVTFHDAYGYFARRYGLEILGFVVEGPEEEPSAADIADLIEAMRARGVARIYREPQFGGQVVEQVANESGASVGTIHSQLSPDVPTYLDLLRANARALTE